MPEYLFDIISQTNHYFTNRLSEDFTTFYSRTDVFKYSFLPSLVLEWNKRNRRIRQPTTMLSFSNDFIKD